MFMERQAHTPLSQSEIDELYAHYARKVRLRRRKFYGPGCEDWPDEVFLSVWRPMPREHFEARAEAICNDKAEIERLRRQLYLDANTCPS